MTPKGIQRGRMVRYMLMGTCIFGFIMLMNSWKVMESDANKIRVTNYRESPELLLNEGATKYDYSDRRRHEGRTDESPELQRPLPKIYPNGELNKYNCDLKMNMKYFCGMKEGGCGAYPQLFNMGDISDNWPPDTPDRPKEYFNSLCRFNLSDPIEKAIAFDFRQYEVPFIVYGVPELDAVRTKWSDEFLTANFGDHAHKVQISDNNHFMFYRKTSKHDPPPTYTTAQWSYADFVRKLKQKPNVSNKDEHYYFFVSHHNKGLEEEKQFDFIRQDLNILDQKANPPAPYANFFLHDIKEAKGIHCRFGMRGIVAEGHYDAGLNMVAMIRGAKRYILSPPSTCDCQYLLKDGPSARHTQVDWSHIDHDKFPLARTCQMTEAVVAAGDILYIPSYWYHHIVSLDQSVQCNTRSGIIFEKSMEFLNKCGF